MKELLDDFWRWLGMSPERYAALRFLLGEKDETEYPRFGDLCARAREIVAAGDATDSELDGVLTVMALTHVEETVLDEVAAHASDADVLRIATRAIHHPQLHARWQAAELLYRRRPQGFIHLLNLLRKDSDEYVRSRAAMCLQDL